MCHRSCMALMVVLLVVGPARADQVTPAFGHIYFGELSLGKGARAWGMGGAQVAFGGDPEAASWNPAALAPIRRPVTAFSIAHENLDLRPRTTEMSGLDLYGTRPIWGRITELASGASGTPFERVAFAFPVTLRQRVLVAQVSYERRVPFSLRSTYAFDFRYLLAGYTSQGYDYHYEAAGSGGVDALSFSAAAAVIPGLDVGVTVHRWTRGFSIPVRERYDCSSASGLSWTEELRDDLRFDLSGTSVDVGTQVRVKDRLFGGFVYRSGVAAKVDYSNHATFTNTDPRQIENLSATLDGEGMLNLPHSVAMGLGVQPFEGLSVGFDYVGTFWADARLRDYARGIASGGAPTPRTYLYPTMRGPDVWAQRDTNRYHLGVEYVVRAGPVAIPLRGGRFWEDLLAFDADGLSQRARGITAGAGLRLARARIDVAWVRQEAPGAFVRHVVRTSLSYAF